jgi:exodeoxyribonuclease III
MINQSRKGPVDELQGALPKKEQLGNRKNSNKVESIRSERNKDKTSSKEKRKGKQARVCRIGIHNINGLKTRGYKLDYLVEWMKEESMDICGLVETNISEREGKFCMKKHEDYKSFWMSANPEKHKGSGVSLICTNEMAKHVGEVKRYNEYLLKVGFFLKGIAIKVIVMYNPPSNIEISKKITENIREEIRNKTNKQNIIVIGDFNQIVNPVLDKSTAGSKKPRALIHNMLIKEKFLDTFRLMNPEAREYTWSNGQTSTRIDQIWISREVKGRIVKAKIEQMDCTTGSDHDIMEMDITLISDETERQEKRERESHKKETGKAWCLEQREEED